MGGDIGIKQRVYDLLASDPSLVLTMGQIMERAGIVKTSAGDVSSALHKLRGSGVVKAVRGPSTSPRGPKFVRLYQLAPVKATVVRKEVAVGVVRRVFNF